MSMDDTRSGGAAMADTDMSDATTDDQELAYGQYFIDLMELCCNFYL